jgi:hypothetical protein
MFRSPGAGAAAAGVAEVVVAAADAAVAAAAVAQVAQVAQAAACRGELAACARPARFPTALINLTLSWPGSTKSTRPIVVLAFGIDVVPVTRGLPCRPHTHFQTMSARDDVETFSSAESM